MSDKKIYQSLPGPAVVEPVLVKPCQCSRCPVLMDIQNETCMLLDMAFPLRGTETRKCDFLFKYVPCGALGG